MLRTIVPKYFSICVQQRRTFSPITTKLLCLKETIPWDFPGGPVVKNPPSNAGDSGSIPGGGTKTSHAAGQVSPHATTTELPRLN